MADTKAVPRARRARGEYAKTGAKRSAILDAALEVFAESGYRSGSLRDIAARVGMSEAGLLHHFKNKSELLAAVLDRRDQQSLKFVDFEDPDGTVGLRGLVRLAEYNASVPGVVELYTTLSAEATSPQHPAHEYFVRRYEFTRERASAMFDRMAAEGRLIPGIDPMRAAVATLAFMDGLQVQWLLDRSVVDMAAALEEFFRGFVIGFTRDDPSAAEPEEVADAADGVSAALAASRP